ncbi:MAG: hypothetical protein GY743_23290 [Planctomycetaceae bacterium]|nr:hypothetical protein [Planctomycetaceae bacterium]
MRRLGLFEIDDIPRDIPGPYTYTVHLLGGADFEMTYNIEAAIETPPDKPTIPIEEAVAGEPEYYQWQDWLRHQEALDHQSKMFEGYAEYCERVAQYIQSNCLADEVTVYTVADWESIYHAALCPQVTIADVQHAMSNTFGAKWAGREIFDAMGNVEGGLGEYISTKVWEVDLMVKLGETEMAYTERGVKERARMIAALKIPQFFGILESDRSLKEARSKG